MKEVFKLYAAYNKNTNTEIIRILDSLPDSEVTKERNMYYKTIEKLISHLATAQ
jgi:uncharacterized damage-inducible protein DinB